MYDYFAMLILMIAKKRNKLLNEHTTIKDFFLNKVPQK